MALVNYSTVFFCYPEARKLKIKHFLSSYGIRNFITVYTGTRQWTLPLVSWIHPSSWHHISFLSIYA
jgi:hypothetical protein